MKRASPAILLSFFTGLLTVIACQGAQPPVDITPSITALPLPTGQPATALARLDSPLPGEVIASPLALEGEARGSWYFEAVFPIRLYDAGGNLLGTAIAEAQGDWMTEEYVPFLAVLEFSSPAADTGALVLERSNPSGLKENSGEILIPIRFR